MAALLFLNGGLGNGVILGPALRQLEKAYPELKYYSPPNGILESAWFNDALQLRGVIPALPPMWRRFLPADRDAVLDFARSMGIKLVVNFRMEAASQDGNYFEFRDEARRRGIECWDLHELDPDERLLPLGMQAVRVLEKHGVPPCPTEPQWLSGRRRPRPDVAGLYIGASVEVKRWPFASWSGLADRLSAQRFSVEVAAGPDPIERDIAERLARAHEGRITIAAPSDVTELLGWTASLGSLVTNDTLPTHLAAALGCPTVGLYLATDGRIWSPLSAPARYAAVQSEFALRCTLMKPDGTCHRFYTGCPAPCRDVVQPDVVARALADVVRGTPVTTGPEQPDVRGLSPGTWRKVPVPYGPARLIPPAVPLRAPG